jgi:hypothetical protein
VTVGDVDDGEIFYDMMLQQFDKYSATVERDVESTSLAILGKYLAVSFSIVLRTQRVIVIDRQQIVERCKIDVETPYTLCMEGCDANELLPMGE